MVGFCDPVSGGSLTARQREALTRKNAAYSLFIAKVSEFCSYSNLQSVNGMNLARQECHDVLDTLLDAYDDCAKADKEVGIL
jgi:hypothetical protein